MTVYVYNRETNQPLQHIYNVDKVEETEHQFIVYYDSDIRKLNKRFVIITVRGF